MNAAKIQRAMIDDHELARILTMSDGHVFKMPGRVVPPETGSVIVIDIQTGAIKAMVSTPTFDPNVMLAVLAMMNGIYW